MSAVMPTTLPIAWRRTMWTAEDAGRFSAYRDGEFAGAVESTADGRYVGFDDRRTPVGVYDSLRDAKRAIHDIARGVTWARPSRFTRVTQALASITGVLAVTLLFAAGAATALPGV